MARLAVIGGILVGVVARGTCWSCGCCSFIEEVPVDLANEVIFFNFQTSLLAFGVVNVLGFGFGVV